MVEGVDDLAVVGLSPRQEGLRLADVPADALLLGLQQVERDGVGQMGAKELVPFVFETREPAALTLGLTLTLLGVPAQVGAKVFTDGCQLFGWYLRRGVQLSDLVFNDLDGQVLEVTAVTFVASEAEEIEVLPLGEGQAEPRAAAATVDRALEVVGVDPLLLPRLVVGGQDLLHLVEQLAGDQRLMPPRVDHAAEGDIADVVGVLEDSADVAEVDWLTSVVLVWQGPQPVLGQNLDQGVEAIVTGGIQLEGQADERGTLGVDDDGAHAATVGQALFGVEVADRGTADRAALGDLLAHALGYFGGEVGRVVLVNGGQDATKHPPTGRLVDVLGGRDQAGAGLANLDVEQDIVLGVARPAVELVDYEIVGRVLAHLREHALELGPVDGAAGFAALDELGRDLGAEFRGFALVGLLLGRQRVAVRVVGLPDLAGGGDAQVGPGGLHAAASP